jgi:hypothetical protein
LFPGLLLVSTYAFSELGINVQFLFYACMQLIWHYMCCPCSLTEYKMIPTKFSSVRWFKNSNLHTSTNLRAAFMANYVELLEEMCFSSLNYGQL